jgi:hypothetical protein
VVQIAGGIVHQIARLAARKRHEWRSMEPAFSNSTIDERYLN